MRISEIELWVLRVADARKRGEQLEDARVELKSEFTPPAKASRQLAAHANAARGEPVLWIIGMDEKRGVTGATATDLAGWYAAVESHLDGASPRMTEVVVEIDGKSVVGLLFDTSRSPYVYVSADGQTPHREVPWRSGTSTRSATRNELLLLLEPTLRLADVEPLSAVLQCRTASDSPGYLSVALAIYIVPPQDEQLVFPRHRTALIIEVGGRQIPLAIDEIGPRVRGGTPWRDLSIAGSPTEPDSATIAGTGTELIVYGPGFVRIRAHSDGNHGSDLSQEEYVTARMSLSAVRTTRPVEVIIPMQHDSTISSDHSRAFSMRRVAS
jgi:hypothetical protein